METKQAQITNEEVINRVLKGEKELYELILRRHNQLLYRVIRSYLTDEDDVKDAMQDTYLRAYEKLGQYRGTASFSTWLIRIGINEALKRIRALKKQDRLSYDPDSAILQRPDSVTPEDTTIFKETRKQIEQAIDLLPNKYRRVFMLRQVEEMSVNDVAACLEISKLNVRVRSYRAKDLLKKKLNRSSLSESPFEFGNKNCDNMVCRVLTEILKKKNNSSKKNI